MSRALRDPIEWDVGRLIDAPSSRGSEWLLHFEIFVATGRGTVPVTSRRAASMSG